jgi:hypothetical protein
MNMTQSIILVSGAFFAGILTGLGDVPGAMMILTVAIILFCAAIGPQKR